MSVMRWGQVILGATLVVVAGCGGSSGTTEEATDASVVSESVPTETTSDRQTSPTLTADEPERVPLGTSANVGKGWHLTIVAVDPDAAGSYRALGDPPAAGESFVVFDVTMDYLGLDEMGSPPGLVNMALVGTGVAHDAWCNIVFDQQLNYQTLVANGESISGQVCYRFPTDQLDSVVLVAGTSERTNQRFALS